MRMACRNFTQVLLASAVISSCATSSYEPTDNVGPDNSLLFLQPDMVPIPIGSFVAGSDYAESVACREGVPPARAALGQETVEEYCQRVGPHTWFLDELPLREVFIEEEIELSVTEVTIGQFADFVDATGYITTAERIGETLGFDGERSSVDSFSRVENFTWRYPWPNADNVEQLSDFPVVHVSREDALAYCDWLSMVTGDHWRLPTADEWEYAALGGKTHYPQSGSFAWGIEQPTEVALGNVSDLSFSEEFERWKYPVLSSHNDGFALASPVATFKANGFGLHDMTGNVWEWTASSIDVAIDDRTPHSFALMKGGAFDFEMPFQRVQKNRNLSFVFSEHRVLTSISIGFRVVRQRDALTQKRG